MRSYRARSGTIGQELLLATLTATVAGLTVTTAYHGRRISRQLARVEEQLALLGRHAFHDPLTGLPNRALLQDRLDHALSQAQRSDLTTAVLLLDLDGFKQVNDQFGHEVGDQVLVTIAQRLQRSLRAVDTVARMGGDEFVILLENLPSADPAAELAERVREAITAPLWVGRHELQLTASIGVASASEGKGTSRELTRRADAAMYAAKQAGKARIVVAGCT